MSETYISVDIEADGPIPGKYSMLSLGAVNLSQPERTFLSYLRPISDNFVPEALRVSGLDRQQLSRDGIQPADAMRAFYTWVEAQGPRPVFVSFSSWDWIFVYWYLMTFIGDSPFGHSSLDMKSYYMGRFETTWRETTKSKIAQARPSLLKDLHHTHEALADAREQGYLFNRMRAGL